jgi:pyrroloquinoline quinone biosynthesis protein B
MRARVLGSAAGGGFPQWNCACPNCVEVRAGSARLAARTQDSVAVTADGEAWFLLNASPDVLRQIEATPELHPRRPRDTPIRGIVLTNGDLDHTLGLFLLRESQPLIVYATEAVWRGLADGNAIFRTLERFEGQVTWKKLVPGESTELAPGLTLLPFAAPGKLPVHLMRTGKPSPEDNVGLILRDSASGRRLAYATACASAAPVVGRLEGVDVLLFDGTFWSEDELVRLGLGTSRARDMAHAPVGGQSGTMFAFESARIGRKIYTHVNNTNPILAVGSPERREVERAGWEVATDGMEVVA